MICININISINIIIISIIIIIVNILSRVYTMSNYSNLVKLARHHCMSEYINIVGKRFSSTAQHTNHILNEFRHFNEIIIFNSLHFSLCCFKMTKTVIFMTQIGKLRCLLISKLYVNYRRDFSCFVFSLRCQTWPKKSETGKIMLKLRLDEKINIFSKIWRCKFVQYHQSLVVKKCQQFLPKLAVAQVSLSCCSLVTGPCAKYMSLTPQH